MTPGKEDEFIERWTDFLTWTQENADGFEEARLIRDANDQSHFVSFATWRDAAARTAWQNSDGFAQGAGACRALCQDFYGGSYEGVVAI